MYIFIKVNALIYKISLIFIYTITILIQCTSPFNKQFLYTYIILDICISLIYYIWFERMHVQQYEENLYNNDNNIWKAQVIKIWYQIYNINKINTIKIIIIIVNFIDKKWLIQNIGT